MGDQTFLYDTNALLAPAEEERPDLVIVVADNDGGGIFSSLEQGAPEADHLADPLAHLRRPGEAVGGEARVGLVFLEPSLRFLFVRARAVAPVERQLRSAQFFEQAQFLGDARRQRVVHRPRMHASLARKQGTGAFAPFVPVHVHLPL